MGCFFAFICKIMIIYVFIFTNKGFSYFFVNMQVGGKKSLFCIFVLYETCSSKVLFFQEE